MISVLVVDDQTLIRKAVEDILAEQPGITVIGQASNGLEAVEQAKRLHPDVVLMDIRMPEMDGIEATRNHMRRSKPGRNSGTYSHDFRRRRICRCRFTCRCKRLHWERCGA